MVHGQWFRLSPNHDGHHHVAEHQRKGFKGFKVSGSGFRVLDLGCWGWGLGLKFKGLWFQVQGLGFMAHGLWFRV